MVSPRPSRRAWALTWTGRGWSQMEAADVGEQSPVHVSVGADGLRCAEVAGQLCSAALLKHPNRKSLLFLRLRGLGVNAGGSGARPACCLLLGDGLAPRVSAASPVTMSLSPMTCRGTKS